jgi:hypothetical protein
MRIPRQGATPQSESLRFFRQSGGEQRDRAASDEWAAPRIVS